MSENTAREPDAETEQHVVVIGPDGQPMGSVPASVLAAAAAVGVPYVLAKGAFVLASTAWNYVLYRRWVFAAAG